MPSSSSVTPDVVRKVAALARLFVGEQELAVLTAQLARIVSYIDQIREIPPEAFTESPRSEATPARGDAPVPGRGEEALEANAPALLHGHGAVPRVVGSGE